MSQFLLPDLGEGLEEAQLVEWLVQEGDTVALNQPLAQVETAKALVDIPSPYAGTVERLHARPGDTIPVGAPLITIAETGAAARPASASAATSQATGGHGPILVGYGTEGPAQSFTRRRRGVSGVVRDAAATASGMAPAPAPSTPALSGADAGGRASPLVRKIAAERRIDLSALIGTGPGGRIRVEDLDSATPSLAGKGPGVRSSASPFPLRDGGQGVRSDDEERISTIGLRKAIAARMLKAATTIPHFTEYGLFDAAALVALRERLKSDPRYAAAHLTYIPFFVRALVAAVRAHPIMNSRWDEEGNAIVVKQSIHVGIATDTARGLLVPVVHNAHTLDLAAIATEANRLIVLARDGKLDAKSLTGGTITITNVGAAGPVDTGAPLINPPEACVIGFGAIKPRPLAIGNQVLVRPSCWLSISCDHRIVDGATAAQFLGALVSALEHPESLLIQP